MKLSQLSQEPNNLTLYTLADGGRTVAGLEDAYAGRWTSLEPAPPLTSPTCSPRAPTSPGSRRPRRRRASSRPTSRSSPPTQLRSPTPTARRPVEAADGDEDEDDLSVLEIVLEVVIVGLTLAGALFLLPIAPPLFVR